MDVSGRESYIRAAVMYGFADFVRSAGGDPRALMEKAGLPPDALCDSDMLISWPRLGVVMELAALELGRPSLGLEWAMNIPPHFPNVGPIIFIAHFAESLRDWIMGSLRYWRVHTNAFVLELVDEQVHDVALRFRQDPLAHSHRQQMELMVGNISRMAQVIVYDDHDHKPSLVRFRHPEPEDMRVHQEMFACPIEFGADHDEIVFPRQRLAYPLRGQLRPLRALFDYFVRQRIRNLPLYDQTVAKTIEVSIPAIIGSGSCNAEQMALFLGVGPKKLQRLLAAEGTSFSAILDEVRRAMACRLLVETEAPIANIAGLLEYASPSPFTVAFKRWTGMTPRDYRKQARLGLLPSSQ